MKKTLAIMFAALMMLLSAGCMNRGNVVHESSQPHTSVPGTVSTLDFLP